MHFGNNIRRKCNYRVHTSLSTDESTSSACNPGDDTSTTDARQAWKIDTLPAAPIIRTRRGRFFGARAVPTLCLDPAPVWGLGIVRARWLAAVALWAVAVRADVWFSRRGGVAVSIEARATWFGVPSVAERIVGLEWRSALDLGTIQRPFPGTTWVAFAPAFFFAPIARIDRRLLRHTADSGSPALLG